MSNQIELINGEANLETIKNKGFVIDLIIIEKPISDCELITIEFKKDDGTYESKYFLKQPSGFVPDNTVELNFDSCRLNALSKNQLHDTHVVIYYSNNI
jgi:hypothetical protein